MDNDVREGVDSLLLSADELMQIRSAMVITIKRIDKIIAQKSTKGKTLADHILNGICSYYKTDRVGIKNYRRNPDLLQRKKMACLLLRKYTDRSLQEIATMLGYVQHATVSHHANDAEMLISEELYGDKKFKKDYNNLVKTLNLE